MEIGVRMYALEPNELEYAASVLKDDGIVVVATETFYGIAANPFSEKAVKRIFAVKRRSFDKPLPLIASSVETVLRIVSGDSLDALNLARRFWPASLTMLLRLKEKFPDCLKDQLGRIGVRVPTECPAVQLAKQSSGWITATSANLSGEENASCIEDISATLLGMVDYVIDSGPAPGGKPSSVVALESGRPIMLRAGAIPIESLTAKLENLVYEST